VLPTGRMTFSCSTRSSFTCSRMGNVADLIEHQRAAVGGHEEAAMCTRGAG